ncbi:MAG: hypothetical protein ACAH11_13375 [Sphingomonas sp.]
MSHGIMLDTPDGYGPAFFYEGLGVGVFRIGTTPDCDGDYYYEAYRGPGHYAMIVALESGATPRCSYVDGDQRLWFDVLGAPSYGVLTLGGFERENDEAQ